VNDFAYNQSGGPVDGWAPHLRIGVYSLLLPLGLGFAILVPWVWLGGFGVVLGIIADIIWLAMWKQRKGAIFPPDVAPGALLRLLVAVVVLGGLAFLAGHV
jgi:hypothetical protein